MRQLCFVVGAGSPCNFALKALPGDYVIAADAGYNTLKRLGITADLLVGDFDSLGFRPEHPNIVEHPPEKDDTDMMLAVKEGLRRGSRTFVILGGLGGRLDHTVANIQTLAFLPKQCARCASR
jgi:thiamine pyrophosphokinase